MTRLQHRKIFMPRSMVCKWSSWTCFYFCSQDSGLGVLKLKTIMPRPHQSGASLASVSFVTSIIAHPRLAPQLSVAAENTSFIREHVSDRHSEECSILIGLCLVELHASWPCTVALEGGDQQFERSLHTLDSEKTKSAPGVLCNISLSVRFYRRSALAFPLSKNIDCYHGWESGNFGMLDFRPSSLMVC